jgi:polyisoprenoid-binding protein YceI
MAVTVPSRTVQGVELPAPGTWRIDPAHSHVEFSVRHKVVGRTRGPVDTGEAAATPISAPPTSSTWSATPTSPSAARGCTARARAGPWRAS